jgi:hypothetical protein
VKDFSLSGIEVKEIKKSNESLKMDSEKLNLKCLMKN